MKIELDKKIILQSVALTLVTIAFALVISYSSLLVSIGPNPPANAVNTAIITSLLVPIIVALPVALFVFKQTRSVELLNIELRKLLTFDQLTGLFTRGTFFNAAQKALTNSLNSGAGSLSTNAVFFGDLDHFKSINDRFGHNVGDEVLRIFGKIMRQELGIQIFSDRFAGRFGGEEVVALIINCDFLEAKQIANNIIRRFEDEAKMIMGHPVAATASIGVFISNGTDDIDLLVSEADKRLYRAKNGGRNTVRIAA